MPDDWFRTNAPTPGSRALPPPAQNASPLVEVILDPAKTLGHRASMFLHGVPHPDSLYQTRITHTPGGIVSSLAPTVEGQYAASQDPIEAIQASSLSAADKQKLISLWRPLGPGFISATPSGVNNPVVMRHEQVHRLQEMPELQSHEADITQRVNPLIIGALHNTPAYQEEMKAWGSDTPVEAREGTAFDLIPGMIKGIHTPTPGLRDYLLDLLKNRPTQRRQLEQLTDVSQLPGYQP